MNRKTTWILLVILLVIAGSCSAPEKRTSLRHSTPEIEAKVASLVKSMTLEEKVGQMTQVTLDLLLMGDNPYSSYEPPRLDSNIMREAFGKYFIGSVLNTSNNRARGPEWWNTMVKDIQDFAIKNNRLGIPIIYGVDMIHGASYVDGATLFPQQIGMAATWNPELIRQGAEVTAYESRASSIGWTFSPVLDLGVDPRWPRQWETFGEDPYLAAEMGKSLIAGLQGEDNQISHSHRMAACLKHYMGYSHTLSGKDRTPAWLPEHIIREYHLPAFKAGVEAGALTVMVNSGEINGVPVHINKYLLNDVLKEELAFEGFLVSDWSDIEYLHTRHKVAETQKEAVKLAINAGLDMSMVPYNFRFADYLIELVNEGQVPMSRIDDAVTRILRVKFLLGIFDTPYTAAEDYPDFGSTAFENLALKTAQESVTLLKNENILPLSNKLRILVAGPTANSMRPLNGGWSYSWQGELADEFAGDYHTIYEALRSRAAKPELVELYEGVSFKFDGKYDEEIVGNLNEFSRKAAKADVIVLCLGENSYTEKPGDLEDLYLSDHQQELARLAAASGKPVIYVLVQGRPRIISKIEPLAKAILNAYLPGNFGGEAIAQIIFGEVNPSGKLPYTYPRFPNSLEPYYIKHAEQLEISGSPTGTQYNPQYHFGYGLTYSSFEYSELTTDKTSYEPADKIRMSVRITNTSALPGKEVVQVFSADHYASLTPSVKRLRAFQKINLQPGESKVVQFEIPVQSLAFAGLDNLWTLEKGSFSLMCGPQITDIELTNNLKFSNRIDR
ncbi:MAG TPA: glycoside hydrolase family 3 N-terminal domain-containing protein [Bacteroidales bacterium]|nr:glycoside hydrolase family 3 N-terminal domain-containing protein [Bacteroidales bacterium]